MSQEGVAPGNSGSEDEGPEAVLLVRGKDEALRLKRLESAARRRCA